jgi:hypothetical protein
MIKVPRTIGPPTEIVELAKNEESRNRGKAKKSFTVYSDPRIKAVLQHLFHGKCAYCESKYQATQPMDVEHWRPKSVYWFLAAEWSNLYPSCIDCNRQRSHVVPLPDGSNEILLLGKLDQFPIDNVAPARDRTALAQEKPLLLDPCNDDPEKFFEFSKQGVVRPKSADLRSETSIRVYALNRMGLVLARYERQLLVGKHIHRIRQLGKAIELINERWPTQRSKKKDEEDLEAIIEDLIQFEMDAMRSLCEDSQPYAAQSRQLVREFFESPDGSPAWLSSR